MGKPAWSNVQVFPPEYIGWVKGTRGSETSQYPQEEKTTVIPLVVGGPARFIPDSSSPVLLGIPIMS